MEDDDDLYADTPYDDDDDGFADDAPAPAPAKKAQAAAAPTNKAKPEFAKPVAAPAAAKPPLAGAPKPKAPQQQQQQRQQQQPPSKSAEPLPPKAPPQAATATTSAADAAELQALRERVAALEAKLVEQEAKLRAETAAERVTLEAQAAAAAMSLQAEAAAHRAAGERLREEAATREAEAETVRAKLRAVEAERDELVDRGTDAAQFRRALDAAQVRISALQGELNRAELTRSEEAHALETQNAALRRDVRTARSELELSEAKVADARTRLQQYRESHAAQREDFLEQQAGAGAGGAAAAASTGMGMGMGMGIGYIFGGGDGGGGAVGGHTSSSAAGYHHHFRLEKALREQAAEVRRLELALAEAREGQAAAEQDGARRAHKAKRVEVQLADSERAAAELERRVAALQSDVRAAPSAERYGQQLTTTQVGGCVLLAIRTKGGPTGRGGRDLVCGFYQ